MLFLEAELSGAASANSPSRAYQENDSFFAGASVPNGAFASIAMAIGGGSKGNLHP